MQISKKSQAFLSVAGSIVAGIVIGGYRSPDQSTFADQCCPVIPLGAPIDQALASNPYSKAKRRPLSPNQSRSKLLASVAPPPSLAGYRSLGFDELSKFAYTPNPDAKQSSIPQQIRELDGQKVCLSGFVIPVSHGMESDKFLLIKNQMLCCYGQTPQMNEWAVVTMKSAVKIILDKPVVVCGCLRVGEAVENGVVSSLYRLEGEQLQALGP